MPRKIAVNTGGGDAPGLNAVIRAVVLSAIHRGVEVWGIRYGYRGLIDRTPDGLVLLDRDSVRGILHLGGTILGSASSGNPYQFPTRRDGKLIPVDRSQDLVDCFRNEGFECLIAIGGDGSLKLAKRLLEAGLPRVIGVPKTIDNDIPGTDQTFGFDTAVATATDALDKLHTTAQAHERVFVIEVMGREAGWIALHSGIAGGADIILIPEIPYNVDRVCEMIAARERRGRNFAIAVVAEGAKAIGGEAVYRGDGSQFSNHRPLGGVAQLLAKQIAEKTGKETRSLVLGHLQRGGSPLTDDRLLALRFGCAATHYAVETNQSGMVALRNGSVDLISLEEATSGQRTVPLDDGLLRTGRDMGGCFGDEPEGAFLNSVNPPPISTMDFPFRPPPGDG